LHPFYLKLALLSLPKPARYIPFSSYIFHIYPVVTLVRAAVMQSRNSNSRYLEWNILPIRVRPSRTGVFLVSCRTRAQTASAHCFAISVVGDGGLCNGDPHLLRIPRQAWGDLVLPKAGNVVHSFFIDSAKRHTSCVQIHLQKVPSAVPPPQIKILYIAASAET